MTWFVYILVCRGDSLYTGISTDVVRRFAQHVAGKGARYTRAFPPERVLVSWPCANRRVALRLEYAIKQLNVEQKNLLPQGDFAGLPKCLQWDGRTWLELATENDGE